MYDKLFHQLNMMKLISAWLEWLKIGAGCEPVITSPDHTGSPCHDKTTHKTWYPNPKCGVATNKAKTQTTLKSCDAKHYVKSAGSSSGGHGMLYFFLFLVLAGGIYAHSQGMIMHVVSAVLAKQSKPKMCTAESMCAAATCRITR